VKIWNQDEDVLVTRVATTHEELFGQPAGTGIDIGPRQQRERSDVGGLSSYDWPRKVGPRITLVTS